ncbi:hypothetical protein XI25_03370 [Paenibacillus sp. DMB20]|nr:hypothetical protein XI25_03370 [Paenibacillus sp. DMB20]
MTVVDVTYTAADPTAAVTIRGGTNLQVGDNRITVTVTVDGATREYIIIVRRAEESIIRPNPPSTAPPSTSPSTPSPTSPTKPEKEEAQKPDLPTNAVTVPDEALSGETKAVHVKLPDGKTSVILSDKQAQKLMGRGLIVESEQAQLNVPAALVESLLKSLPASEKSASIVIRLEAVETTKAQQLLQKANGSGNARYTLGGKMLTLSLAAIDGNGKQHRLDPFPKPAKLTFRIPAGMNPKLAGIYQMAGNGAIHVGGKLNADRSAMEVELSHFGEYALLSLDKSYADVDVNHWAYETIHELSAKQIINGMTETRFAPTGSVTRAEFAALLARTLNLSRTGSTPFSDVADDAWYAKEVSAAYQSGIVTGAGQKLFEPNRKITREEMAVMLVRAYELQMASKTGAASAQMKDENFISGWALPYVKKAVEAKLLSGRKEGLFVPNGLTTRAEAAQAVYNLLQSFARADA